MIIIFNLLFIEVHDELRGKLTISESQLESFGEMKGIVVAAGFKVGIFLIPCQQLQIFVNGGYEFRAEKSNFFLIFGNVGFIG